MPAKMGQQTYIAVPQPLALTSWRNRVLIETIQKHGDFLDYLLTKAMLETNHFKDFLVEMDRGHKGAHNTEIYWRLIVLTCLVTACVGVFTDVYLLKGKAGGPPAK